MREGHVVVVLQAPTDGTITHTFLPLFQLFQEAKVPGYNCNVSLVLQSL